MLASGFNSGLNPGFRRLRTRRCPPPGWLWSLPAAFALVCAPAAAAPVGPGGASMHHDPIAPVLLGFMGILFLAILGRFAARRIGQPSVLGELIIGIVIGNLLYYFQVPLVMILREGTAVFDMVSLSLNGTPWAEAAHQTLGPVHGPEILKILLGPRGQDMLQVAHTLDIFSRYGVIFLLFLVGLESSVQELRQVGGESMRVAVIGVAAPFVLGFTTAYMFMPELSGETDLFLAAALGATSVGITARVLQDLNQMNSRAARVILGAAVIDDVLGLILLAVVSGVIVTGAIDLTNLAHILLSVLVYLALIFLLGPYVLRFGIWVFRRGDVKEAKLFISLFFLMALAWLANLVGLAAIVGAFAAGLMLHDKFFTYWGHHASHERSIKDLFLPIEAILAPVFFVLMGLQVKLESLMDWHVVIISSLLIVAAILGKLASALGCSRRTPCMAVGVGMLPRGEVGLIFASIGKSLGVIGDVLFSAVVIMVIVTTLITPPLLKLALRRAPNAPETA